jgi:hypothetical protein
LLWLVSGSQAGNMAKQIIQSALALRLHFADWAAFVPLAVYRRPMNAARYFMQREDYQPRQTLSDSPFRQFDVKCLRC